MTDMSLFGANPGGHHMTSLVLHASEMYRILERIAPDKARFIQPSQWIITQEGVR